VTANIIAVLALLVSIAAAVWAKNSATEAKRVADAEVDRDHNTNAPPEDGEFVNEGGDLYYEFSLPRDYEMRASTTARAGTAYSNPQVVRKPASGMWWLMVDTWTGHGTAAGWDTLTIDFWPPVAQPGKPTPWTCRCDREKAKSDKPGHWQWDIHIPHSADGVVTRSTTTG
jgi:hypothetical protein